MEQLLSFLDSIATAEGWPLSESCLDYLRSVVNETTVTRGAYILQPGQICRNIYFIKQGLLKCFYILHDKEVPDWFFGPGEAVVALESYYDQVPSTDYIQAVDDTQLYYISHDELNHIDRTYVEFNVVGRVLTNKYLRIWHRYSRMIRMRPAEERYTLLLDQQPELIQKIPVRDLGPFLDMSRETFTRMRGKIIK